jgi:hypothetical protein
MTMNSGQVTITFDEMVDALANVQRRKLLIALMEHNPQDDAPVVVAASERETEAVERLVMMQQVHLPKLNSLGLVRYDTETKEARSITGELSQELLAVIESYETTE